MQHLSDQDQRALTLGATVILISLGVLRGVPAVTSSLTDVRIAAVSERRALADARALVEASPRMRDSLVARRQRLNRALTAAITASDPTAAASTLGAIVSAAARDVNVTVNAVRLRPDSDAKGFSRPRVAVDARGDVSGLVQLLLLLEESTSILSVAELAVTQAEPGSTGRAEDLSMMLVVGGLARADSSAGRIKR